MTEDQIKHMVNRFLGWKLPENFNPDGGVSFKRTFNDHLTTPSKYEPSGTNLLNATQATVMVRHMLEGLPPSSADQGTAETPDGYALVPLKPAQAVIEAGSENNPTQCNDGTDDGFAADVANDVYVSMVRAAPPAPHAALPPLVDRNELIALLQDLASVNLSREACERQARRMADDLIARGLTFDSSTRHCGQRGVGKSNFQILQDILCRWMDEFDGKFPAGAITRLKELCETTPAEARSYAPSPGGGGSTSPASLALALSSEREERVKTLDHDAMVSYLAGFDDATEVALAQHSSTERPEAK